MNPVVSVRRTIYAVVALLIATVLLFPPPLGFEPRDPSQLRSQLWIPLFTIAFLINIAAIPLLLKRARVGAAVSILLGLMNLFFFAADQLQLVTAVSPPVIIFSIELFAAIVSILILILAQRVYSQSRIASY